MFCNNIFAQEKRELKATYTNEKIIIDGMDNELSLSKTQVTSGVLSTNPPFKR